MKWQLPIIILLVLILTPAAAYLLMNPEKNVLDEATRNRLGGTYVKLSQGVTHYKLSGPDNGKTVVLVHGATIPIWTWDNLTAELSSSGFRVLSYDAYGRGYSDRPDVDYDQGLFKHQLLDLVDTLALKKPFDLVGLSLGAATAVNFTAQHPERVNKLVLIQPIINNVKAPTFFGIPVIGEFIGRFFGIRVIANRASKQFEGNPKAETYSRLFIEQTIYKGFEKSILSMLRHDAIGDYSDAYRAVGKQQREVLLIWGDQDSEVTPEVIDLIRSLIPHITFKPVTGVAHGIVFQRPDEVNRLIREFIVP
jgi:pimeloyl-ACP methyl ester carboxylesterase